MSVERLHDRCRPPFSCVQPERDHWLRERVEEEHNHLNVGEWHLRQLDVARRDGLVTIMDAALVQCSRTSLVRLRWSNSTTRVRRGWRRRRWS